MTSESTGEPALADVDTVEKSPELERVERVIKIATSLNEAIRSIDAAKDPHNALSSPKKPPTGVLQYLERTDKQPAGCDELKNVVNLSNDKFLRLPSHISGLRVDFALGRSHKEPREVHGTIGAYRVGEGEDEKTEVLTFSMTVRGAGTIDFALPVGGKSEITHKFRIEGSDRIGGDEALRLLDETMIGSLEQFAEFLTDEVSRQQAWLKTASIASVRNAALSAFGASEKGSQ